MCDVYLFIPGQKAIYIIILPNFYLSYPASRHNINIPSKAPLSVISYQIRSDVIIIVVSMKPSETFRCYNDLYVNIDALYICSNDSEYIIQITTIFCKSEEYITATTVTVIYIPYTVNLGHH
jgi:hypothetical protein